MPHATQFDSTPRLGNGTTPSRSPRTPRGAGESLVRRSLVTAGALALAVAGLAGCSASGTGADSSASVSASVTACPVSVTDAWVKAAESGMTSAFATLSNASGQPLTVTAASSPVAEKVELHEVVDVNGQMKMQQVQGGFTVPANGSLTLEPGGYHLMLIGLKAPVKAGDEVTFTVTCGDSGSVDFAAQAKAYTGADETYDQGGMQSEGSSDMPMQTPSEDSSMPSMPSADASPQPMEDTAPTAGSN